MKTKKDIHSLADTKRKGGQIRFIHSDGTEHKFYSVINTLSGSRLSGFDGSPPSVDDSLKWVKSVFKDIRKRSEVIEVIGDF